VGLARSQRAQSPQAAAGRHRELHRCGLRDGRDGAAAKSTAQSGEHRTTRPSQANKPRGPAQSPNLDEREVPVAPSRQLPALLQAEGPAALVASRGGGPAPNQVAQRLRRAGLAAARPRRVTEKQLKLAPGQNGLGAAGRYRRGTIKAAAQLHGRRGLAGRRQA
jgi:hypothetical protein